MKLTEITNVLNHGDTHVNVPTYVFHLTMEHNIKSILAGGIRLGMGNAHYSYQSPRVFCLTTLNDANAIEQVASLVVSAGLPPEETHNGAVVAIQIDTRKLPKAIWLDDQLYRFTTADSASVWTSSEIPPSACAVVGMVDWMTCKVVPFISSLS